MRYLLAGALVLLVAVAAGALLASVALSRGVVGPETATDCAEPDGACLTWDDIRESPVYSEGGQ